MARLVLSILLLLVLVAVVAFNAGFTSEINLFGYRMSDVPTVAIGLTSFVLGVIYSFLLYLMSYFARRKTERLAKKRKIVKGREQKLEKRQDQLEEREGALKGRKRDAKTEPQAAVTPPQPETTGRGDEGKTFGDAVRTFFGRSPRAEEPDKPAR